MMSFAEIGKEIGTTPSGSRFIYNRAIRKIKRKLTPEQLELFEQHLANLKAKEEQEDELYIDFL